MLAIDMLEEPLLPKERHSVASPALSIKVLIGLLFAVIVGYSLNPANVLRNESNEGMLGKPSKPIGDSPTASTSKPKTQRSKKARKEPDEPTEYQAATHHADGKRRCWGSEAGGEMRDYHDNEWGRPEKDSRKLFAQMSLQAFQSGLSWKTILMKKQTFFSAFDQFDYAKIAKYSKADEERLMNDPDIVRNRLKILSTINNAKLVQQMEQASPGAFAHWVWSFAPQDDQERLVSVKERPKTHMRTDFTTPAKDRFVSDGVHPTVSIDAFAKDAKKKGFKFTGPTTALSFFQASGLVNHHGKDCFAYHEINAKYEAGER